MDVNQGFNLIDHIDYLIGGSIVNKERQVTITSAAYFQEPELIEQLKDKLEKKDLFDRMATENAMDRGAAEGN